jgi:N-acetylneuraminate synthase
MPANVNLGAREVGQGDPCLVIGEIGINHNGEIDLCKQLITVAARAGCEVVKFQKRTIDLCFTPEQLGRPTDNPFGPTYGDQKRGLEFGESEYRQIAEHCASEGIGWTASCWDPVSVDFIEAFDPPFYKVASASLTEEHLLAKIASTRRPVVLSTGMSSIPEIDRAVEILGTERLVLLHCTSTYPTPPSEINLRAIPVLRDRYGVPIGFSSHELGTAATIASIAFGACIVERHITVDKTLWGTDQPVSLEPDELTQLVKDIRLAQLALGDGVKLVYDSEAPVRNKLRYKL